MCNDLGAVLLTEDGGKQAGCCSWIWSRTFPFPWSQSYLALGQVWTKRFTLGKKKCNPFFIILFINLFYAFQTMATCISYAFYLSSVEMLTLLIKSLTNPNLNPLSQAQNKETLPFFSPYFFGWLVIFCVITVTFFSMYNVAISPQAFNFTQKNRFNSVQIMPDNVAFHTG